MSKYLTEFIGTFFLVLTIGLTAASGSDLAPLAVGSVLMALVYMGWHVSGAHYNPAISLAVFMRGKIAAGEAVKYMAFQLAGAVVAALAVAWLADEAFVPSPGIGITTLQAFVAEFLFTFGLALVILNVAFSERAAGNSYYGLAIGFTVTAGMYAVGGISAAVFNPAVGLGPIFVGLATGAAGFGDIPLYVLGPFAGAALAAVVFKRQSS